MEHRKCTVVIAGNFNINILIKNEDTKENLEFVSNYGMQCHINELYLSYCKIY